MASAIDTLPLVLTVEETAEILRISRGSAYEVIRTGEIPHVRIGRSIWIPRHLLTSLLGVPPDDGAREDHAAHGHLELDGPLRAQVADAR